MLNCFHQICCTKEKDKRNVAEISCIFLVCLKSKVCFHIGLFNVCLSHSSKLGPECVDLLLFEGICHTEDQRIIFLYDKKCRSGLSGSAASSEKRTSMHLLHVQINTSKSVEINSDCLWVKGITLWETFSWSASCWLSHKGKKTDKRSCEWTLFIWDKTHLNVMSKNVTDK